MVSTRKCDVYRNFVLSTGSPDVYRSTGNCDMQRPVRSTGNCDFYWRL